MPLFCVPHYHVLLRDGYAVWTYSGWLAEKQVRLRCRALAETGMRPIILTCHYPGCLLYGSTTPDDLSEEKIHERISKERHTA